MPKKEDSIENKGFAFIKFVTPIDSHVMFYKKDLFIRAKRVP